MNFSDLIRKRYSVRAYRRDAVPEEMLQQVLEAGCLAPTAANRQPFQIIVLRTAGREEELRQVYHRDWLVHAPIVLAVCAVPDRGWVRMDGKGYADVDATIVMDHLVLAATDLGLGTCWIAAFDPEAARQVLHLPDGVEPIAFTPLGYAADEPGTKVRQPLSDLVRYDTW